MNDVIPVQVSPYIYRCTSHQAPGIPSETETLALSNINSRLAINIKMTIIEIIIIIKNSEKLIHDFKTGKLFHERNDRLNQETRLRGYKLFFMLNSVRHEIFFCS